MGMNVMTEEETHARTEVMYDNYTGTVEIEAKCMIDMIQQHVIPSAKKAELSTGSLASHVKTIESALAAIEKSESPLEKATLSRKLRLETMEEVRKTCDDTEALVPPSLWTLGTYTELLFLDKCQGALTG